MGQKINPNGLRVGVIKNWESRWYANDKDFGDLLVEDYKLRKFLEKKLERCAVSKIEIERDKRQVRVNIHTAKPGVVIGRGGTEIEKLKEDCEKILNKNVSINIVEIKQPDLNAKLVAEKIAAELEARKSFRRVVKRAIGFTMKLGAKGIKVQCSGRLGGAEIARTEHYHEGTIPLSEFAARPVRRDQKDILVRIIIKKDGRKAAYTSQRNSRTDFPVIACCVSNLGNKWFVSVGARPAKAKTVIITEDDFDTLKEMAKQAADAFTYGDNVRASGAYRKTLATVYIRRLMEQIKGRRVFYWLYVQFTSVRDS